MKCTTQRLGPRERRRSGHIIPPAGAGKKRYRNDMAQRIHHRRISGEGRG